MCKPAWGIRGGSRPGEDGLLPSRKERVTDLAAVEFVGGGVLGGLLDGGVRNGVLETAGFTSLARQSKVVEVDEEGGRGHGEDVSADSPSVTRGPSPYVMYEYTVYGQSTRRVRVCGHHGHVTYPYSFGTCRVKGIVAGAHVQGEQTERDGMGGEEA